MAKCAGILGQKELILGNGLGDLLKKQSLLGKKNEVIIIFVRWKITLGQCNLIRKEAYL